jgi:hypothetical protein
LTAAIVAFQLHSGNPGAAKGDYKDKLLDAVKLAEAAKAQNVKLTTEIMQRIHLRVRELRMEKPAPPG